MKVMADGGVQWLLAMCRRWLVERTGFPAEPVTLAAIPADEWLVVAELARVHSVEPVLFAVIAGAPDEAWDVPRDVLARWEKAYYSHLIRNTEALTVLAALTARCHASHIPVIALKGPAVIADVYRDIGLRPMADLDLLCHTDDLVSVARHARSLGFRGGSLYQHHVVLEYGAAGGLLELHFDLHREVANRARFLETAWSHATVASVEDWLLPVMSLEDQIIFDVAHMTHHAFDVGVKHFMDFAGRLMLHRADIDWDRVGAALGDVGLSTEFLRVAGAVERAFLVSLDLPIQVARVRPAAVSPIDVLEHIGHFGAAGSGGPAAGVLRQPGFVRKAAYAWRRLCPPLRAVQAAFDSPTRLHALVQLPAYVGKTLWDVGARRFSESKSGRKPDRD